jgi:hypothetical protein
MQITLGKTPKKFLEITDLNLRLEVKSLTLKNSDAIEQKNAELQKKLAAGEIRSTEYIRESLRMVLVNQDVSWAESLDVADITKILQAISRLQQGDDAESRTEKKSGTRKS